MHTASLKHASTFWGQGFAGKLHYATLDLEMSAKGDSRRCLTDQTCVPLGGHSVWAALPPLPSPGAGDSEGMLPITMVLAQIDGSGLFHDSVKVREHMHGSKVKAPFAWKRY
jgi:hypothetical protein